MGRTSTYPSMSNYNPLQSSPVNSSTMRCCTRCGSYSLLNHGLSRVCATCGVSSTDDFYTNHPGYNSKFPVSSYGESGLSYKQRNSLREGREILSGIHRVMSSRFDGYNDTFDILENASTLFDRAHAAIMLKGRTVPMLATACFFVAGQAVAPEMCSLDDVIQWADAAMPQLSKNRHTKLKPKNVKSAADAVFEKCSSGNTFYPKSDHPVIDDDEDDAHDNDNDNDNDDNITDDKQEYRDHENDSINLENNIKVTNCLNERSSSGENTWNTTSMDVVEPSSPVGFVDAGRFGWGVQSPPPSILPVDSGTLMSWIPERQPSQPIDRNIYPPSQFSSKYYDDDSTFSNIETWSNDVMGSPGMTASFRSVSGGNVPKFPRDIFSLGGHFASWNVSM